MADATYNPKVYRKQGGDELVVASGGEITVESGGNIDLSAGGIQLPSSTLGKGFIPIGIFNCRLLSSDAFLNTIEAGTPDGNTNPSLQRVNSATDKAARLIWASSNSDEIQFPSFAYPPDLDDSADITIHVLAAMGGATDTPVLTVSYWEGLGDTNAGGATAAVTGTTIAEYTRTIAAADVGAHPKTASVGITPGAHTTDALHIYNCWVEYTRKTS